MKHVTLREFCRYFAGSTGFDDRLGVLVVDGSPLLRRIALLVARKLHAVLDHYRADDYAILNRLRKRAAFGVSSVVILTREPSREFLGFIEEFLKVSECPLTDLSEYRLKPLLIIVTPAHFMSAGRAAQSLRRVGCFLDVNAELLEGDSV